MKSKFFLLVALVLLSCSLSAFAQARIPVNHLPFKITKPGNYYFPKDLVLEQSLAGGAAIIIQASNVDLDLNGRALVAASAVGQNTVGIVSAFVTSVTVHNGTIRGFHTGLIMEGMGSSNVGDESTLSSDFLCERLRVTDLSGLNPEGIAILGNHAEIRNCQVVGIGNYGINLRGLNMFVRDCDVSGDLTQAVHVEAIATVIEHSRFHQTRNTRQGTGIFVLGTTTVIDGCDLVGYEDSILLGFQSSAKYRNNSITNCTRTGGTDAGGNY